MDERTARLKALAFWRVMQAPATMIVFHELTARGFALPVGVRHQMIVYRITRQGAAEAAALRRKEAA